MGTVWRAEHLGTQREVALKLLRSDLAHSTKAKMRFEREVELAARLDHPNIARVYDSGLYHDKFFYTMELVRNTHLDKYVEENQLSQREILSLMKTVCQAVQHAHQKGVVHRDLKPSNILVTKEGQPLVVDFGLAKTFDDTDHRLTVSADGEVPRTPAFMSPEQASGKKNLIDTRSDVYSLGVMLYYFLTNQWPQERTGPRHEVERRIAEEEVRRPRNVSKKIDRELEALLLKSLALDHKSRYRFAGDLAADIDNYLHGELVTAKKPTIFYFLRKRLRKHYLPATFTLLTLIALLTRIIHKIGRASCN